LKTRNVTENRYFNHFTEHSEFTGYEAVETTVHPGLHGFIPHPVFSELHCIPGQSRYRVVIDYIRSGIRDYRVPQAIC
jgi:hypothetical protein